MFKGIEKFIPGRFSPTPEEEEKDPEIRKKMEAANEAARRKIAEQAREKLRREMEQLPGEENPEEKELKVA
ncbi:MAG: hypothetical protein PHQ42_04485 [Patescibacteria group bacterium]|nr:hypothetical protein [Patescibacteria group bacterium]